MNQEENASAVQTVWLSFQHLSLSLSLSLQRISRTSPFVCSTSFLVFSDLKGQCRKILCRYWIFSYWSKFSEKYVLIWWYFLDGHIRAFAFPCIIKNLKRFWLEPRVNSKYKGKHISLSLSLYHVLHTPSSPSLFSLWLSFPPPLSVFPSLN